MAVSFQEQFAMLFEGHYRRVYRLLDRLSGDADLAADLAQETFIRLYQRGAPPDRPAAWLISVALNLLRNEATTRRRRDRLLSAAQGERTFSDSISQPDQVAIQAETRRRVRAVIDDLPDRERQLLLLRAEGYSYQDIANALELNPASVGVMLARAKREFRSRIEDLADAFE